MKLLSVSILLFFSITAIAQKGEIVQKNAKIEKAGGGYAFTEGPAEAPDGKVYFTDQPNDRIYVWDEKKGVSLWLEGTRRSNGMYFSREGHLYTCADLYNQLGYCLTGRMMFGFLPVGTFILLIPITIATGGKREGEKSRICAECII